MMRRLFVVIEAVFMIYAPAFGLSDSEYSKMMKDPEFSAADRELARAYNEAKRIMSESEFAGFRRDQREWIAKQRDVRAKTFMEDGYSRVEAYTKATLERARRIRARLRVIQTCVIDDVGEIDEAYYDNGKGSYLHLSLVSRAQFWFEVSFAGQGDKVVMMGYFDPDDNTIRLDDDGLQAVLTFSDKDTLSVKVNGAFRRAFTVDANGIYTRHYGK
ncbi:MAG: DUF1311 domain-containing protein [Synergistaceae bacterium]|nr:DUF1311 domain-containing protein [Synergistaceae bacterium]